MSRVLPYAPPPSREWIGSPAYGICIVLNILALVWNLLLMVWLTSDDGWARLGLIYFGGIGFLVELMVSVLPSVLFCAMGKFTGRARTRLLFISLGNALATLTVVGLAIMLPNRGGC